MWSAQNFCAVTTGVSSALMAHVTGLRFFFFVMAPSDLVERYEPRKDRWDLVEKVGVVIKFSSGCFVF